MFILTYVYRVAPVDFIIHLCGQSSHIVMWETKGRACVRACDDRSRGAHELGIAGRLDLHPNMCTR
jgi:hypothetical protein